MKRKSIIQGLSLCAILIFFILTSGCATTHFATGSSVTKIRGTMTRQDLTTWDAFYPWKVSNIEVGTNESTSTVYTIDSGMQKLQVAYTGNRHYWKWLRRAGPVEIELDLKPNRTYQVDGKVTDKAVVFVIRDQHAGEEIARSAPTEVVIKRVIIR
jgi:hypothetical protein